MSSKADEEVVWSVDWGGLPEEDSRPVVADEAAVVPAPIATSPLPANPPPVFTPPIPRVAPPSPIPPVATVPAALPPVPVVPPVRLVRGQRLALDGLGLGSEFEVSVRVGIPDGLVVDVVCLGLDEHQRLSDDRYFIYYNRRESPCGGMLMRGSTAGHETIGLFLDKLPAIISRVIVGGAFDGPGKMSDLGGSVLYLGKGPVIATEFAFSGADLDGGKSLMMAELYRKNGEWRIAALGQGFSGGLAALLQHFGARVS